LHGNETVSVMDNNGNIFDISIADMYKKFRDDDFLDK